MAAGSRTHGGTLRYETILKLASGGMATVYVGTVRGALGFRQLVAIKKPHPHLLDKPDFRRELLAEAQLASMIHHANVVDVRDVEVDKDSISLVMDYIEGASLGEVLVAASKGITTISPAVVVRIVLDACAGLHAAHELTDDKGRFIGLVHRDISPQNILVGTDGVARVTDFGIAKIARKQSSATQDGHLKGKIAYMAPEYLRHEPIDRRFDVFAMGVVLWEALTGRRLFRGEHEVDTLQRVMSYVPPRISELVPSVGTALDHVVAAAVEKKREDRFQNVAAMAAALETAARGAGLVASHTDVATLLRAAVGADLEERRTSIRLRLASMDPAIASVGPSTPGPPTDPMQSTIASPPTTLPETALPPTTQPQTPLMYGQTSTAPTMLAATPATLMSADPLGGATIRDGSRDAGMTLGSATNAPSTKPFAHANASPFGATVMAQPLAVSAPPISNSTLPLPNNASAPAPLPRAMPMEDSGVVAVVPMGSKMPIFVGVALIIVAAVGGVVALRMRAQAHVEGVAPVVPDSAPPKSIASSAASTASAIESVPDRASAPILSASAPPKPTTQPMAKKAAHPTQPQATSAPAPNPLPPQPTSGPPPNPYANER